MLSETPNEELLQKAPDFAEKTLKLHRWVENLLQMYAKALNVAALECDHSTFFSSFIRFLGLKAGYALSSLSDAVVPALKRIFLLKQQPLSKASRLALKQGIKDVRSSRARVNANKKSKAPLLLSDLTRIIAAMPDSLASKPMEASLFLFSIFTGARAITCAHILLKNISVLKMDRFIEVRIILNVAKGIRDWGHIVTLRGCPDTRGDDNIIFWLNTWLSIRFGITLTSFNVESALQDSHLFPISTAAMCQRLQSRAYHCGWPLRHFGFHSLRSGFICTAMLQDPSGSSFLEKTALVAGWQPGHRSQLLYIREAAKALIIANNLLLPSQPSFDTESSTNSEFFHRLALTPRPYQAKQLIVAAYQEWRDRCPTLKMKQMLSFMRSALSLPPTSDFRTLAHSITDFFHLNHLFSQFLQHHQLSAVALPSSPAARVLTRKQWSPSEDAVLLSNPQLSASQLAHLIPLRTPLQCRRRKNILLPLIETQQQEQQQEQERESDAEDEEQQPEDEQEEQQEEEEFEVETIVKKRGPTYLIKWVGYDEETWEHEKNLVNCKDLLKQFKKQRNK